MTGRGWTWVAPDNWPPPPEGWAPYPGWQPDPAWPAPPVGHQFWKRRRRSKRMLALVVAACVLSAAAFGGFIVAVASLGSCAFDPPSGDVGRVTLTNDLTRDLTFPDCLNAPCTQRDEAYSGGPVSPGASIDQNHELCGEEPVAVVDAHGHLLGCLVLPAEDPATVRRFYASAAAPCR